MDLVEIERKLARKAGNNARGAIGRDVFSVLHYSKTHYMHNWVDIVFAELKDSERYFGNVFQNGKYYAGRVATTPVS
jgi:hypothetical protein